MSAVPGILLARLTIRQQLRHWTVYAFLVVIVATLFGVRWDPEINMVQLFGITGGKVGELREYALQDAFIDLHLLVWILACFFYLPLKVLLPLAHSFDVSNRLWLRFSVFSERSHVVYRALITVFPALLFGLLGLVWALLFSAVHDVALPLLLTPLLTLFGYMLFVGAAVAAIRGRPVWNREMRLGVVIAALLLPIIFSVFQDSLSDLTGGLLPFAAPPLGELTGAARRGAYLLVAWAAVLFVLQYFLSKPASFTPLKQRT